MSKWTGKKSPVNLPRGRRDSASINISHFHKGIPVWIENTYEEKSSHYRSTLLPVNYSTRPTWIPGGGNGCWQHQVQCHVFLLYHQV